MNSNLKKKLEEAFEIFKSDVANALIISHLQSDDKEVNVYLIAKQPNQEMYFGILETKYISQKQVAGIPFSNLDGLGLKEVPMQPFWSKPYIEQNIKIKTGMNIVKVFYENKDFRKKIIFLHYAKSKNYISTYADDLLHALGFSSGLDGIPFCVTTTPKANSFSIDQNGEIIFEFETGFIGLPCYTNIVELLPLLSYHCYGVKDSSHLLERMKNSNNSQLLAFRDTIIKKAGQNKINELVKLLNKPEINPDINSEESVVDLDLLVLNKGAYERVFKNLITEEILEPYRKK